MNTAIEDELQQNLARLAQGAPSTMRLTTVTRRAADRRRRRVVVRGALVGIAMLGAAAGVYGVRASRPADPLPVASVAGLTESPLMRLENVSLSTSIVKSGAIALQLSDGQQITFGVVGMPYFDGYNQAVTIQIGATSNGRIPPAGVDVTAATEPELGGNDTVVFWTGLPASVTRVEFHLADGASFWQTPVAGIAVFPVTVHYADDTLIGYDSNGNEVQSISWAAAKLTGLTTTGDDPTVMRDYSSANEPTNLPQVNVEMLAELTQAQEDGYRAFGDDTMRSCLATEGDSAWTGCIESTDAAVKEYLANLQATIASKALTAPTSTLTADIARVGKGHDPLRTTSRTSTRSRVAIVQNLEVNLAVVVYGQNSDHGHGLRVAGDQ